MKKMILFLLVSFFLSNPILAFKKKDSLNLGKALLEEGDMFNAGTWDLYIEKCSGKFHQQFREDLAGLSWADFVNYTKGKAKYDNNYSAGSCSSKDTDDIVNWFNWIISELERQTNGLRKNTLQQTIDPVSKTINIYI